MSGKNHDYLHVTDEICMFNALKQNIFKWQKIKFTSKGKIWTKKKYNRYTKQTNDYLQELIISLEYPIFFSFQTMNIVYLRFQQIISKKIKGNNSTYYDIFKRIHVAI